MILPPPSPSPDRGVRCGGWWWRGGRDAVEVVLGYLFFRSDCLAVREPAPEGAWLAVPGPGWGVGVGDWGRSSRVFRFGGGPFLPSEVSSLQVLANQRGGSGV